MRAKRGSVDRESGRQVRLMARKHYAAAIIVASIASVQLATKAIATVGDQIGPDPLRSERCVVITYGYSVMCAEEPLGNESNLLPAFILSCGSTLSILLLHQPVYKGTAERTITLDATHGEFTEQWLGITPTLSVMHLIRGESDSAAYYWALRLSGLLATSGTSRFRYSIEAGEATGMFNLGYSDQKMIEQIVSRCASD